MKLKLFKRAGFIARESAQVVIDQQSHHAVGMERRTALRNTILAVVFTCWFGAFGGNALFASSYSDAESSAKDLFSAYEDFRKLDVEEEQNLVKAIAEADDDARREVAATAADKAASKVTAGKVQAERIKDRTIQLLDQVLADQAMKDKWDNAKELKEKVETRWKAILRMEQGVSRGANNPVVAYMLQAGKELHASRQSGCTVKEFNIGGGRADCIRDGCEIIEFKPDNSRAKDSGTRQLREYREALLKKPDVRSKLNSESGKFSTCTDFSLTIEAYTLIPDIDSEGNYRERSASWSTYTVRP